MNPELEGFSGRLPLFPLPNVVLFPHGLLPLHVFEPRYRAMTEAALDGERLIGMAVLKPGWEADYAGRPAVHEIVGVGRIVQEERLPDGRYNMLLAGLARARVRRELPGGEFRIGEVELLEDRPAEGAGYERRRKILHAFYARKLREATPEDQPAPDLPAGIPLGDLCDLIASAFVADLEQRVAYLAETDVAARCDRLMDLLRPADPTARPRNWPPQHSQN